MNKKCREAFLGMEGDLESQCILLRFLYYVYDISIIDDVSYDYLEKKALKTADQDSILRKVGSGNINDYPDYIVDLMK
jgi:hypothetical protein